MATNIRVRIGSSVIFIDATSSNVIISSGLVTRINGRDLEFTNYQSDGGQPMSGHAITVEETKKACLEDPHLLHLTEVMPLLQSRNAERLLEEVFQKAHSKKTLKKILKALKVFAEKNGLATS